jgi:hypothetical protein
MTFSSKSHREGTGRREERREN